MAETYYTIGMAGHIDHGKTTLTKALTQVDTDRLKEEKERGISIELGYAPLKTEQGTHVSIVDVPGHERFIRQMIAGVAGIDLVVLVVAADEGVMPQTEEHLEILQFLGIQHCIVAITKTDRVDEIMLELVTEDIKERLTGTIFDGAPYLYVDSISGNGVDELRNTIFAELARVEFRDAYGSFRLPIDQVFTVQGQGTIIRGTIYEGVVQKGSQLMLLPGGLKVKARQIQVHNKEQEEARAGQRTAVNLGGVEREQVKRGNVLVASEHFLVTDTIDVALKLISEDFAPLKQRAPVKVHVGTSEVMGKLVLFDRNELMQTADEVLCQIRLDEEVVVRRGDRFILRRPTPVETLGGGWVIEPKGGKYRFGQDTIKMLKQKQQGTPEDLIRTALEQQVVLNMKELIQQTSLTEQEAQNTIRQAVADGRMIDMPGDKLVLAKTMMQLQDELEDKLADYHTAYPLRPGIGKAELIQLSGARYPKLFIEFGLNRFIDQGYLVKNGQYIALADFEPHLPAKWKTRMEGIISALEQDGLEARKWEEYTAETPVPQDYTGELSLFLLQTGQAYRLTDDTIIHRTAFSQALKNLQQATGEAFGLKEAKDALGVSRKYLIPFLELLDQQKITVRHEDQRKWRQR